MTARDASALLVEAQRDAARRPRDAHAQFVLGECLVQFKRYDEALPPLLAAERLDSSELTERASAGCCFATANLRSPAERVQLDELRPADFG